VVIACASSSVDETLSKMREEFEQLKAHMKTKDAEIAEMQAEITKIKSQRNATTTAGKLEFFVDGRTMCPEDMIEVNATKGMILLGRPNGGKTGAVFNRPLDAGEVGRSPPHSHAVTVDDPGHTHVGVVTDPGHDHAIGPLIPTSGNTKLPAHTQVAHDNLVPGDVNYDRSNTSKTGITVSNLPDKSAISVSIDANDAGEHIPLVYVLICQKIG
jgi:hypothetical protein